MFIDDSNWVAETVEGMTRMAQSCEEFVAFHALSAATHTSYVAATHTQLQHTTHTPLQHTHLQHATHTQLHHTHLSGQIVAQYLTQLQYTQSVVGRPVAGEPPSLLLLGCVGPRSFQIISVVDYCKHLKKSINKIKATIQEQRKCKKQKQKVQKQTQKFFVKSKISLT